MSRPPSQIDGYGVGRVYKTGFDADTQPPPHPGYRGLLRATEIGVFLEAGLTEFVLGRRDGSSDWYPVEHHELLPWNQVALIEWDDKHAVKDEAPRTDDLRGDRDR